MKFKVGDKVILNDLYFCNKEATINEIDDQRQCSIRLQFDNYMDYPAQERELKLNESIMDSKKIAEKINALPICQDGKRGVKDLVEALGFKVEDGLPKAGEVWSHYDKHILIINSGGFGGDIPLQFKSFLGAIDLQSNRGYTNDVTRWHNNGTYKKIADSLEEYYKNKLNKDRK